MVQYVLAHDIVSTMLRFSLGLFFFSSGLHKTFVKDVRNKVWALFDSLGVGHPFVKWPVPLGELFGGLGLFFGCLTAPASCGLMLILAGAICLDCWQVDVVAKHPRNPLDWIAKTVYMPEFLLMLCLAATLVLGPGRLSMDYLILRHII